MTKGSLHFPIDRPLPKAVVQRLIAVRLTGLTDARGETLWSSSRFRAQLIDGIQRQSGFRIAMRLPTAPNIRTVGY
jgi:hypothetical protein